MRHLLRAAYKECHGHGVKYKDEKKLEEVGCGWGEACHPVCSER